MNQVILIMTDTQRKDMLGCYNRNRDMHTPNLDGLAARGLVYNRAYTCQPVCGPARSSIFTGTFPHTNGMLGNSMFLNQGTKTIGQRLKSCGINCGFIGKWHLDGGDYFGNGICPDGWNPEYWYDMRNYLEEMTESERYASRQFETALKEGISPEFTFAHKCSAKALDFLEKYKEEDFFLTVSYDEPHHPFLAPKEYFDYFKEKNHTEYGNLDDSLENKPEHIKVWAESTGEIDYSAFNLLGCNSFADSEIGRVLEKIYEAVPDALVIYTSDHGDALGAHGISGKGPAMFDEITNIPFIMYKKDSASNGNISGNPVSHVDIVPTVLDYFGLDIPKSLEGHSLICNLTDSSEKVNENVFMEFTRYEIDHDGFGGYQPIRAVTDGRYKLAISLMTSDELYDTEKDPGEMTNLINEPKFIDIRNKLHDKILEWMNETRDPSRGYYWERRPWRTDARKATWDYTRMTRQRHTENWETSQLDYSTGLPIKEFTRIKD
jgi:uncharacterized sulfatase